MKGTDTIVSREYLCEVVEKALIESLQIDEVAASLAANHVVGELLEKCFE